MRGALHRSPLARGTGRQIARGVPSRAATPPADNPAKTGAGGIFAQNLRGDWCIDCTAARRPCASRGPSPGEPLRKCCSGSPGGTPARGCLPTMRGSRPAYSRGGHPRLLSRGPSPASAACSAGCHPRATIMLLACRPRAPRSSRRIRVPLGRPQLSRPCRTTLGYPVLVVGPRAHIRLRAAKTGRVPRGAGAIPAAPYPCDPPAPTRRDPRLMPQKTGAWDVATHW